MTDPTDLVDSLVDSSGYRATPSETLLLARLRAGDEMAYGTFVDRHHGSLLRLAFAFVSSRAVAEEVVQETWTAFVEGLSRFQGRSSLRTWLFRILTNRAKTRGIREGRSLPFSAFDSADGDSMASGEPERFRADGSWANPPTGSDDPEVVFLRREAIGRLAEALSELAPGQRAVVTLRDVEGLDATEVCNVLQITETNQRVLLHRARARLRSVLGDLVEGREIEKGVAGDADL